MQTKLVGICVVGFCDGISEGIKVGLAVTGIAVGMIVEGKLDGIVVGGNVTFGDKISVVVVGICVGMIDGVIKTVGSPDFIVFLDVFFIFLLYVLFRKKTSANQTHFFTKLVGVGVGSSVGLTVPNVALQTQMSGTNILPSFAQ